jgi:hypothetical protein
MFGVGPIGMPCGPPIPVMRALAQREWLGKRNSRPNGEQRKARGRGHLHFRSHQMVSQSRLQIVRDALCRNQAAVMKPPLSDHKK